MSPDWEVAFEDAVLETDYRAMGVKIDSAVTVLCGRLLEIGRRPEHLGERHRIVDALQTLHMIRRIDPEVRVVNIIGSRMVN